jgi:sn-glycerol 3-phosphate transport system ATP-binding protein
MNAGIVEQIGKPIDVYAEPASLFVAGFIGSPAMNFLPGKRSGDDVDVGGGVRIALPAQLRQDAPDAITVGIRPEHLVPGEGAGGPVFRFKVETVEALGADSMVHGEFGAGTVVARVEGHATPALGTALHFSVMPGKLYFFDTVTGKRLGPRSAP